MRSIWSGLDVDMSNDVPSDCRAIFVCGSHCRPTSRAGGRVYAEGGGLAYICETMRCDSGCYTMAGLLPAEARYRTESIRDRWIWTWWGNPWFGGNGYAAI